MEPPPPPPPRAIFVSVCVFRRFGAVFTSPACRRLNAELNSKGILSDELLAAAASDTPPGLLGATVSLLTSGLKAVWCGRDAPMLWAQPDLTEITGEWTTRQFCVTMCWWGHSRV
jgi:hypothetical protein